MQSRRGFIAGGIAAVAALIGGLSRGGATAARRTHNPEVVGSTPTPAMGVFEEKWLTEARLRQCIENIRNQRPAWHSDEDIDALAREAFQFDARDLYGPTRAWRDDDERLFSKYIRLDRPGTWTP